MKATPERVSVEYYAKEKEILTKCIQPFANQGIDR